MHDDLGRDQNISSRSAFSVLDDALEVNFRVGGLVGDLPKVSPVFRIAIFRFGWRVQFA